MQNNDEQHDVCFFMSPSDFTPDEWLLLSSASSHIATSLEMFIDYQPALSIVRGLTESSHLVSTGSGTVRLVAVVNGRRTKRFLNDVLHVPCAPHCALSIQKVCQAGFSVRLTKGGAGVQRDATSTTILRTNPTRGGSLIDAKARTNAEQSSKAWWNAVGFFDEDNTSSKAIDRTGIAISMD